MLQWYSDAARNVMVTKNKTGDEMGSEVHNRFFMNIGMGEEYAAVIAVASYFDAYLEKMLRSYLLECDATNELFDGTKPLSAFSAKITMARSIGLITEDMYKQLHILRRLRNSFAHEWDDASLIKHFDRANAFCGGSLQRNPKTIKVDFVNACLGVAKELTLQSFYMRVNRLRLKQIALGKGE